MQPGDGEKISKSESEFSVYQSEIEATDNVILCVAKAEKMIREIGKSLLLEKDKNGEKIDVTDPVTEDHSE
jgi:hypothetical protein